MGRRSKKPRTNAPSPQVNMSEIPVDNLSVNNTEEEDDPKQRQQALFDDVKSCVKVVYVTRELLLPMVPQQKLWVLGQTLYPLVLQKVGCVRVASKITGMLLQLELDQLIEFMYDLPQLTEAILQAEEALCHAGLRFDNEDKFPELADANDVDNESMSPLSVQPVDQFDGNKAFVEDAIRKHVKSRKSALSGILLASACVCVLGILVIAQHQEQLRLMTPMIFHSGALAPSQRYSFGANVFVMKAPYLKSLNLLAVPKRTGHNETVRWRGDVVQPWRRRSQDVDQFCSNWRYLYTTTYNTSLCGQVPVLHA
eukprot:TRINITY_DN1858_c0_g2_i2.p1 TRINITY_DN1858_c0_g2~~TRINITY_DN1858_c0_g2_i2.p1  ORF type:complete len:311 (-),score=63.10 TRINITY_DN1858_c0_g2_i2:127-1059(-)